MSWHIGLLVNEPIITMDIAKKLVKACGNVWDDIDDVTYENHLFFNEDHMEWMDFIGDNEKIVTILKKAKVKGDICFGSLEGDNAGSFWGYRFDGKGGMKKLCGSVVWKEE